MFTCSKLYENLPAAHRQHNHDGHCALIHGHNWAFKITFGALELDENGFVIDFGKLKFVKDLLEDIFDHTLLLNEDDPHLPYLQRAIGGKDTIFPESTLFSKIVVVPNCGAECLAQYVAELVGDKLTQLGHTRVAVVEVVCFEDSKNSATWNLR